MTGELPWKVYGLVEHVSRFVYYVGIAKNVRVRIYQHRSSSESAVYDFIRQIVADGEPIEHCILGECRTKEGALHLEASLIASLPATFNRTHGRKWDAFWAPVAHLEFQPPQQELIAWHC